ncbi:hypothetical protein [Micromonospora thermarum]|uniref:Uncharacterized protein n=1 Tax=Micromonospora thermarum TaxID=2720024 RepID=A0ABX0Z8Y0_9ACTN|nr:hypothetical protein [Micromonospora thermarum]NJP33714.1 hypothetical protein [Micromonospora thermarum]
MYKLITILGPVVYAVLLIGSAIVVGSGRRGTVERRHRQFLALQAGCAALAWLLALTLAVGGEGYAAALYATVFVVVVVGAAYAHRRYLTAQHRWETRMRAPTSLEAFLTRYEANASVTWGGAGDQVRTVHVPCPFCAAAEFAVYQVSPGDDATATMLAALSTEHHCVECHRGGVYHLTRDEGRLWVTVAHTAGVDPPPWLPPYLSLTDAESRRTR